jgi:hypothetical protein
MHALLVGNTYTRTDTAVAYEYLLKLGNLENEFEGAAVAVSWVID